MILNKPTYSESYDFFNTVYENGKQLDLSQCVYGLFHDNKTVLGTSPYYYFLAGLAEKLKAAKIIEIGTYRGGSTKALAAGMLAGGKSGQILTFDVKNFNPDFANFYHYITHHIGYPTLPESIEKAMIMFEGETIDILFIDAAHEKSSTLIQTLLYDRLFTPRCLIWDDISINKTMMEFQKIARIIYPEMIDVSQICPHIRRPSEGFGVWMRF